MAEFVKVTKTAEIEPGGARLVEVNGKQIALFNVAGQFFASTTRVRTRAARWPRGRRSIIGLSFVNEMIY